MILILVNVGCSVGLQMESSFNLNLNIEKMTKTVKLDNANDVNTQENEMLTEVKEIKGSPFVAVKHGDLWFVALGKYRISDDLPSYDACVKDIEDVSWMRILAVMTVVAKEVNNE